MEDKDPAMTIKFSRGNDSDSRKEGFYRVVKTKIGVGLRKNGRIEIGDPSRK